MSKKRKNRLDEINKFIIPSILDILGSYYETPSEYLSPENYYILKSERFFSFLFGVVIDEIKSSTDIIDDNGIKSLNLEFDLKKIADDFLALSNNQDL